MLLVVGFLLAAAVFLRACEIRGTMSEAEHPSLRRLALLVAILAVLSLPALFLGWVMDTALQIPFRR